MKIAPAIFIIAAISAFILLTFAVMQGYTQAADEWLMGGLVQKPGWLTTAAKDITALGSQSVVLFLSLCLAVFCTLTRRFYVLKHLLLAIAGAIILNNLLKEFGGRERPATALVEVSASSYPSGHAFMAAVFYLLLPLLIAEITASERLKNYLLGCGVVLVAFIGLSRIYLGVHYPTDVLAGWIAGGAWVLICRSALPRTRALKS